MFDFHLYLEDNEEILYEGRPVPGKGNKQLGGILLIILFTGSLLALFLSNAKFSDNLLSAKSNLSYILMLCLILFFLGLGCYALLYNFVFKKIQTSDDFYCLTNRRVMKYESRNQQLSYGYLGNYQRIYCTNEKDGFGDVHFEGNVTQNVPIDPKEKLRYIKEAALHPDRENTPSMLFESVEYPGAIQRLAETAKEKI